VDHFPADVAVLEAVVTVNASHVIDYHTEDVAAEVMRITSGEGVDVIMDALGPKSFRVELATAPCWRPPRRVRRVAGADR